MMNKVRYIVVMLLGVSVAAAYGVVVQDFSRYEVILDRQPFGEAPSDAELAAAARASVPAGPSFVDALRLCAITAGGGVLRVGFVDTKSKPPKTYFLFVGESEDGIEVVDADYESETALLRKDGEEQVLRLSGGGAGAGGAPAGRAADESVRESYVNRRRSRAERLRKLRQKQFERKPELTGEALEKHLRQYNMDLIRAGGDQGVPLPIPLTPEEDAQLVEEGVLAPIDE